MSAAESLEPKRPLRRVLITSPKGGVGKTQLARNLTVAAAMDGLDVGVVDLDPQHSLIGWVGRRAEFLARAAAGGRPLDLAAFEHYEGDIRRSDDVEEILTLDGHELVVIDTPTSVEEHGEAMKRLIIAADLVLVPCQATIDDASSVRPWMQTIRRYGKQAAFVMNRVKPRSSSTSRIKRQLAGVSPNFCPVDIRDLEEFHRTSEDGLGMLEIRHKGREDVEGVWAYVSGALWGGEKG